ncbi:CRISPR-associated endoribonuclease Cas2 [Sulfuracidifex tepidarius]|uniref:CRISPR-associated endoribonuclease Cas2 n=1 Tax=Sulfuracidifex tepidarius TaxID=1294262 RepID=A0A510DSS8_9CREN|nr:CRISPR-associated endonuclease Cas2 [Sulfuracidifex tepidarius]BBG23266.1 CRISPR-associated endoribonuclease Cas2 [Sulfuracidifex tepidarius]
MLYVILVYDIDETRVAKVLKICRKYLTWVQRSVFEGEITEGNLELLLNELRKTVRDKDNIMIYRTSTKKNFKVEVIGESMKDDFIL